MSVLDIMFGDAIVSKGKEFVKEKVIDKAKDLYSQKDYMAVNLFNTFNKDNVVIPNCLFEAEISFVIADENNRCGCYTQTLDLHKRILRYLEGNYDYIIFRRKDLSNYGIMPFAMGEEEFVKYKDLSDGELYAYKNKNRDKLIIGTLGDCRLLKERFKVLGCGEVFTKQEMDAMFQAYKSAADFTPEYGTLYYQLLVDIAYRIIND